MNNYKIITFLLFLCAFTSAQAQEGMLTTPCKTTSTGVINVTAHPVDSVWANDTCLIVLPTPQADGSFDYVLMQNPNCRLAGLHCWDVNQNGVADPAEDKNNDGLVNTLDCQGAQGAQGLQGFTGQSGQNCFDNLPDLNGDGIIDIKDCQVQDTYAVTTTATTGGTDALGNTYNAGDVLLELSDGTLICIPEKHTYNVLTSSTGLDSVVVLDASGNPIGSWVDTDTYSYLSTAPANGVDAFGNTYETGDLLLYLPDGTPICVPNKIGDSTIVVPANGCVFSDPPLASEIEGCVQDYFIANAPADCPSIATVVGTNGTGSDPDWVYFVPCKGPVVNIESPEDGCDYPPVVPADKMEFAVNGDTIIKQYFLDGRCVVDSVYAVREIKEDIEYNVTTDTLNGFAWTYYITDAGDTTGVTKELLCDLVKAGQLSPCSPQLTGLDCDCGGIEDLVECANGNNPTDRNDDCAAAFAAGIDICDLISADPYSPLATADCDGGGVDNATECANGGDPSDPTDDCQTLIASGGDICAILATNPNDALATQDCDGGGVDNLTECQNGGDPTNPDDDSCANMYAAGADLCAFILANPTHPLATADCDNGGVDNITECQNGGDPFDFADDCQAFVASGGDICTYIMANPNWGIALADCDMGGVLNITECQQDLDPTDPVDDQCIIILQTGADICMEIANGNTDLGMADCDGDGQDNALECSQGTDPSNSCDNTLSQADFCALVASNPAIAALDCDNGGIDNETECAAGTDPRDGNPQDDCQAAEDRAIDICAYVLANPVSPLALADCDSGGIDNLTECQNGGDPFDPTDDIDVTLVITKTASVDTVSGQFTFDIVIQNTGTDAATNVTLTDIIHDSLTIISTNPSANATVSGQNVTKVIGTLAAGNTVTCQITVEANQVTDTVDITNTATVDSDETSPISDSDDVVIIPSSCTVVTRDINNIPISQISSNDARVCTANQTDCWDYTSTTAIWVGYTFSPTEFSVCTEEPAIAATSNYCPNVAGVDILLYESESTPADLSNNFKYKVDFSDALLVAPNSNCTSPTYSLIENKVRITQFGGNSIETYCYDVTFYGADYSTFSPAPPTGVTWTQTSTAGGNFVYNLCVDMDALSGPWSPVWAGQFTSFEILATSTTGGTQSVAEGIFMQARTSWKETCCNE